MTIKVLGVDPGLASTGIGIVSGQNDQISNYAYGVVNTAQNAPEAARLAKIYLHLRDLIADEKPDLLIIEEVFSLDKFPRSGIGLGKVCGVVLLAGHQAGTRIREVAVRESKQVLTGNGNASKQQLEKAVRNALGCEKPIRPYHASDALGLALIGLFRYADSRYEV